MSPDPAVPGKNLTFAATGDLDELLSSGKYETVVYFGVVPVFKDSGNVCDIIKDYCPCPCSAGKGKKGKYVVPVQNDAPKGQTLNGNLKGTDQNGKSLICMKFTFKVAS
jgi:hypothetical protein